MPLSDMTAGIVDSQRVWGDNNSFQPGMVAKCALRWYKYRTLYSYDMDAKSLFAAPYAPGRRALSARRRQAILTMLHATAGRWTPSRAWRAPGCSKTRWRRAGSR
ncbi:MAG TPA: hypothetical protein VFJ58_05220 [Armatimonadota bacterium]|nr:hypothetical protein [Armatimonadota bacterium]